MLLTEIWKTCSTDQNHETGKLNHTRTEENVTAVDEMFGWFAKPHKPEINISFNTPDIQRKGSNKV